LALSDKHRENYNAVLFNWEWFYDKDDHTIIIIIIIIIITTTITTNNKINNPGHLM